MLPPASTPKTPPPVNPGGNPQDQAEAIRSQLTQILNQAAKVAADNGIDFQELVMQFMRGNGGRNAPPTPPAGVNPAQGPQRPAMGGATPPPPGMAMG
jgi:hypothetical protein